MELDHGFVYCGNSCEVCPSYRDRSCGGCRSDKVTAMCAKCEPRLCCREKNLSNCGVCGDYPCAKVNEMYARWTREGFGEGAIICRRSLDLIHAGGGK